MHTIFLSHREARLAVLCVASSFPFKLGLLRQAYKSSKMQLASFPVVHYRYKCLDCFCMSYEVHHLIEKQPLLQVSKR